MTESDSCFFSSRCGHQNQLGQVPPFLFDSSISQITFGVWCCHYSPWFAILATGRREENTQILSFSNFFPQQVLISHGDSGLFGSWSPVYLHVLALRGRYVSTACIFVHAVIKRPQCVSICEKLVLGKYNYIANIWPKWYFNICIKCFTPQAEDVQLLNKLHVLFSSRTGRYLSSWRGPFCCCGVLLTSCAVCQLGSRLRDSRVSQASSSELPRSRWAPARCLLGDPIPYLPVPMFYSAASRRIRSTLFHKYFEYSVCNSIIEVCDKAFQHLSTCPVSLGIYLMYKIKN